ncbi:NAD(+) synthase [Methanosarcinales archaeon]|nr:MAG: NAD(+) synthase [Methanosarcinales archaeon]
MQQFVEECCAWIKGKVREAGAEGVVVGMSGGLDSSVTAVLCKKALPKSTLGLIMPIQSSHVDTEHALLVSKRFDIDVRILNLEKPFYEMLTILENNENKIPIANLKSRLRMCVLYYYANRDNLLVAGTSNKSEIGVGYFTKYGDGASDILPIGSLLKSEVRKLGEYLGIPEPILKKPPSSGLWPGHKDEEEMGITYTEIDAYLSGEDVDEDSKKRIEDMMRRNRHKLESPYIFIPSASPI